MLKMIYGHQTKDVAKNMKLLQRSIDAKLLPSKDKLKSKTIILITIIIIAIILVAVVVYYYPSNNSALSDYVKYKQQDIPGNPVFKLQELDRQISGRMTLCANKVFNWPQSPDNQVTKVYNILRSMDMDDAAVESKLMQDIISNIMLSPAPSTNFNYLKLKQEGVQAFEYNTLLLLRGLTPRYNAGSPASGGPKPSNNRINLSIVNDLFNKHHRQIIESRQSNRLAYMSAIDNLLVDIALNSNMHLALDEYYNLALSSLLCVSGITNKAINKGYIGANSVLLTDIVKYMQENNISREHSIQPFKYDDFKLLTETKITRPIIIPHSTLSSTIVVDGVNTKQMTDINHYNILQQFSKYISYISHLKRADYIKAGSSLIIPDGLGTKYQMHNTQLDKIKNNSNLLIKTLMRMLILYDLLHNNLNIISSHTLYSLYNMLSDYYLFLLQDILFKNLEYK